MSQRPGPNWMIGAVALVVAGACIGLLVFMLWPR